MEGSGEPELQILTKKSGNYKDIAVLAKEIGIFAVSVAPFAISAHIYSFFPPIHLDFATGKAAQGLELSQEPTPSSKVQFSIKTHQNLHYGPTLPAEKPENHLGSGEQRWRRGERMRISQKVAKCSIPEWE